MEPKYPNITVKLVGEDGNALSIISRVRRALRAERVSKEEIAEFVAESTKGDYDHVLQTAMDWVKVE